jgi:hypothetical protein
MLTNPRVQEALDIFLAEGTRDGGGTSTLDAALGDARAAMGAAGALWLGTIGYLIVLESVGATVARWPSTRFTARRGPTEKFIAGAREFAPKPVTPRQADALYALRCSLAHSFDLRNCVRPNKPAYRFVLDQEGPLIRMPTRAWDGRARPHPVHDMKVRKRFTTAVNVREVARYVEALIANLRSAHRQGRVTLVRSVSADDVIAFGQFYVA